MVAVHIKSDERRAVESNALRSYGIDPRRASAEQREHAASYVSESRKAHQALEREHSRRY